MKIVVDTDAGDVVVVEESASSRFILGSPEAFAAISKAWLRSGWDAKYVYGFTWLGRPIIQLPEDLIRIQETIFAVRPDVIIETGIAHGGSLVFYASLCKVLDRGRVIGVDIEIRPHNRKALDEHPLRSYITLVEGSSVAPEIVDQVKAQVRNGERVLVMLDSCHTKAHVLAELEAYSPLVGVGSYLVAADGIMADLVGAPRSNQDWAWNNPKAAVEEFTSAHPEFVIQEPPFPFNEGAITNRVTYWPYAFLQRVSS